MYSRLFALVPLFVLVGFVNGDEIDEKRRAIALRFVDLRVATVSELAKKSGKEELVAKLGQVRQKFAIDDASLARVWSDVQVASLVEARSARGLRKGEVPGSVEPKVREFLFTPIGKSELEHLDRVLNSPGQKGLESRLPWPFNIIFFGWGGDEGKAAEKQMFDNLTGLKIAATNTTVSRPVGNVLSKARGDKETQLLLESVIRLYGVPRDASKSISIDDVLKTRPLIHNQEFLKAQRLVVPYAGGFTSKQAETLRDLIKVKE